MDTSVIAELKLYNFDSKIVIKYKLNIIPKSQKIKKYKKTQKKQKEVNTLPVKYYIVSYRIISYHIVSISYHTQINQAIINDQEKIVSIVSEIKLISLQKLLSWVMYSKGGVCLFLSLIFEYLSDIGVHTICRYSSYNANYFDIKM